MSRTARAMAGGGVGLGARGLELQAEFCRLPFGAIVQARFRDLLQRLVLLNGDVSQQLVRLGRDDDRQPLVLWPVLYRHSATPPVASFYCTPASPALHSAQSPVTLTGVQDILDYSSKRRFERKVTGMPQKLEYAITERGCWVVTSHKPTPGGYVIATVGGKRQLVHRWAWKSASGREIEWGSLIRHTCHNPPCINPADGDGG